MREGWKEVAFAPSSSYRECHKKPKKQKKKKKKKKKKKQPHHTQTHPKKKEKKTPVKPISLFLRFYRGHLLGFSKVTPKTCLT